MRCVVAFLLSVSPFVVAYGSCGVAVGPLAMLFHAMVVLAMPVLTKVLCWPFLLGPSELI